MTKLRQFKKKISTARNSTLCFFRHTANLTMLAMVFTLTLALQASAQSQNEVTLQSPNGSMTVTGELVSVDDDFFTVRGTVGLMKVPRDAVLCIGESCPSGETSSSNAASIRDVTLNSIGDETRISGELINVEGEHYIIRNALGEFRVKISNVECVGQACPTFEGYDPKFTIVGASLNDNLMVLDLLQSYTSETGEIFTLRSGDGDTQSVQVRAANGQDVVAEIELKVTNPEDAVKALSNKSAEILVFNHQKISDHFASYSASGNLWQNPLAFDGHVIIAHPDNPVRNLSLNEIKNIWSGALTSWKTLGAGSFPIALHMVDQGTDATDWLTGLNASNTPGVVTHRSEAHVIEAVKSDRYALCVVHQTVADSSNAKMLAVRKVCGLTAEPSKFGLRTKHYPFTQAINTYGRSADMHPFAQSFIEWTQTESAAQQIAIMGYTAPAIKRAKIQDMGVAIVHTAAVEPDFDGAEFAAMMRELRAADRLSITFRFLTGSSVLDEASISNIKDTAKRLRGNEFDGQDVLLVGFSDSTGPAGPNTTLSNQRAEAVRSALAQELDEATRGSMKLTSMGFGEQMPVDCNNTETGRANNRRVEVWLRVQN